MIFSLLVTTLVLSVVLGYSVVGLYAMAKLIRIFGWSKMPWQPVAIYAAGILFCVLGLFYLWCDKISVTL